MNRGRRVRRRCWSEGQYIRSYGCGAYFMDENGDDATEGISDEALRAKDWEECV